MTIPDFQTLMLPLLKFAADGAEHSMQEAREKLADEFSLTEEERKTLLPSGKQPLFPNRVAWAKVYLSQAGVLEPTRRGYFRISGRGQEVLKDNPKRISIKYLDRFEEFVEFRTPKNTSDPSSIATDAPEDKQTPEEMLDTAYQKLRQETSADLISRIKKSSAQFFEQLVVEVLLKMGYGGSRKEAGRAIGKSGDEGIDGIINEDRLGLDLIYLQAKKWEGTVGRPEIQRFVGALHGKRAKKGVFITTGTFSSEAFEYIEHIEPKIVLIDGPRLAELMMDFDVGVTESSIYRVKRIDSDYFGDE